MAFGGSRHLITRADVGDRGAVGAAVGTYAARGSGMFVTLTAVLAISNEIAALVAGLLRLRFVARSISEPVLKGLIIGIALTIIAGQLPKLLGIRRARATSSRRCGT